VDFEREGLLAGLTDEQDRAARLGLLERLAAQGFGIDELKRAASEDRLALLPLERLFEDRRHTVSDVARATGLTEEYIARDYRALGFSIPEHDEPAFTDADLESYRTLKAALDAEIPEERLVALSRTIGNGAVRTAQALLHILTETFLRPGDTERDLALRYAEVGDQFIPVLRQVIANPVNMHLRELVINEAIGEAERRAGRLPGTREVTIAFADLVEFTALSESASVGELGELVERFTSLAAEVATPPVRFVKSIGDAAMFACHESVPLVEAMLALIDAGTARQLPEMRVGVARGHALPRAGDWYGRPVNLASRITASGKPGMVVAADAVRRDADAVGRWTSAGEASLKGIESPVELFRLEPDLGKSSV
jgi:adenylate cyclase